MPNVTLEACGPEKRATIQALLQLYIHDFSEFWAGQARGELQEDGRFGDYPGVERYWTEAGRSAWLIRADGNLAGFALLSAESHSGRPADHDVSEFFVARKHRRGGVGFAAARQLIAARTGLWEIAVTRANVGAQGFWRRVARDLARGEVDEQWQDDDRWNGMILRFTVASA